MDSNLQKALNEACPRLYGNQVMLADICDNRRREIKKRDDCESS